LRSKIIITILIILIVISSGCIKEKSDDKEEKSKDKGQITKHTTMLYPRNITYFDGRDRYYEGNNTYLLVEDDEDCVGLSGDCMSAGRGMIIYNFTNSTLSNISASSSSFVMKNATLIVKYKTDQTNFSNYIEWSIFEEVYFETNITPQPYPDGIIVTEILFSNSTYYLEDLKNLKIKFYNPRGGIIQLFVYFDFVWIKIDYELQN
jgi:hypothetical protein